MLDKLTSLMLASTFAVACASGAAAAATPTVHVVPNTTKAVSIATAKSLAEAQGHEPAANVIRPDSPAPPLTSLFVLNVCSSTACETIGSNQASTADTYSGPYVYTVVWEIGYGYGEIATQGGIQLASNVLVEVDPVCVNGGYYTVSCPVGSLTVGFRYIWDVGYWLYQGYGPRFTAADTSEVLPINHYSTALTINYLQ
jgi:hypothetical protein